MTICKVNLDFKITKEEHGLGDLNDVIEKDYKKTVLLFHGYLKNRKNEGKELNIAENFLLNLQNAIEKAPLNITFENEYEVYGNLNFTFNVLKENDLEEYIETMLYHKHIEHHKDSLERIKEDIEKYKDRIKDEKVFEEKLRIYMHKHSLYEEFIEYVGSKMQIDILH